MTNQQIFNTVYKHLIQQGDRAIDEKARCVYRASDGKKCAAGCLIPDDDYNPEFEHTGVDRTCDNAITNYFRYRGFSNQQIHLIGDLQGLHDGDLPEEWEVNLSLIAEDWELEVPV